MAKGSKPFGTVKHMTQSAPAKIEKRPGMPYGPEHPSAGMGRGSLPGQVSGPTMSKTKDFDLTRKSAGGTGDFAKGATNTTGRALSTAMIGRGGEKAHVARVGREADGGAGMSESAEFKNDSADEASGY